MTNCFIDLYYLTFEISLFHFDKKIFTWQLQVHIVQRFLQLFNLEIVIKLLNSRKKKCFLGRNY